MSLLDINIVVNKNKIAYDINFNLT